VIFNANATTQISFNGNQGTVILGTGVTVTGNVITFAPDTGFVAFRGGGTLSGNAGTAALPLQQISLGGNSIITGSAAAQTFNLGLNTLNIGGPLTLASNPVLDVSINPTASGRILASGATNFPSAVGFGLSYNAINATDTRSELGARFDDLTTVSGMPLVLRARLAGARQRPALRSAAKLPELLRGRCFLGSGHPSGHCPREAGNNYQV
jgi:hypothetical protein